MEVLDIWPLKDKDGKGSRNETCIDFHLNKRKSTDMHIN